MHKPTYKKLDANLNELPDDHPNEGPDKHLLVRVSHPMLTQPFIVSAYRAADRAEFAEARKIAEEFKIHDRACRPMSVEEAFFIPDRTRDDERLDPNFFPDAEDWERTWTGDVDSESPQDYAWGVGLGVGGVYRSLQDNRNHVRPVLAGECQRQVSLRDLHSAWLAARRGKKPSLDQFAFDTRWLTNLQQILGRLNRGEWFPSAPMCFIEQKPKVREIHAPTFADRVIHHLIVPRLERIYEPTFIHDSFSNRKGKGTHAAVARLQRFVRQINSGQGGGFYLQLDIRNFFNSIHRPTLYAMLKARMARAGVDDVIRRAVHALLDWPISRTGVNWACSPAERAAVPPHKRLENSPPGCGIAIGNLSSQFFANVYLDRLDQFVKHELKAPRYVRYVDDFVLVSSSIAELAEWHRRIAEFLREDLKLEMKPAKVEPLKRGIDFLGYVIYPTHAIVRRRVVAHCREKLAAWEREHCRDGRLTRDSAAIKQIRSIWHSYLGHFSHACCFRLRMRLYHRFPWLAKVVA